MNIWYLYLIRCKNGRLYTEHENNGKKGSKYLRGKAPLTLVMKKKIGSRSEALKIEARVRKLSKTKKELLVDGGIKIREILE